MAAKQVMGFENLVVSEKPNLNAVEAKIQETPTIYKGIERICDDPTPLWKKMEDYRSAVSAYLSLKKAASLCHYLTVVEK